MEPNKGSSTDTAKLKRIVETLAGIFADMDVVAAMYIIVDVWEGSFGAFHKFVWSPSLYGNFAQPNLAHMIAEQAVKDTVWYHKARADPEAHQSSRACTCGWPRFASAP